jgi:hypothetical protein
MATVDWESEIEATKYTPRDALADMLEHVDDMEAVVIVAAFKPDAKKEEWRECLIVRRSTPMSYPCIGLLSDGLDSMLHRQTGE